MTCGRDALFSSADGTHIVIISHDCGLPCLSCIVERIEVRTSVRLRLTLRMGCPIWMDVDDVVEGAKFRRGRSEGRALTYAHNPHERGHN